MFEWLNRAELGILDGLQALFGNRVLDVLMPGISFFGNAGWAWIAMAIVLLFFKKHRKTGFTMLLGMLAGLLCGNLLLKLTVMRDRPCWINSDFPLLIGVPKDYSFPSGHTLASVISATVLAKSEKHGWIAFVPAGLIAFSRLYLYVHFPTDVLAGALLGVLLGVCACLLAEKLYPVIERKFSR